MLAAAVGDHPGRDRSCGSPTGGRRCPIEGIALGIVSGAVEAGYFVLLSAAYRRGDLSVVYPLARGTAPLIAVAIGVADPRGAARRRRVDRGGRPARGVPVAPAAVADRRRALAAPSGSRRGAIDASILFALATA